jgi:hypothetical protein
MIMRRERKINSSQSVWDIIDYFIYFISICEMVSGRIVYDELEDSG